MRMFLSAAALLPLAVSAKTEAVRPNIVVILADDLGWADLSCYGSTFHETPNLDRLAREGMRFTAGYASSPYCSPSRASLLTGRSPARLHLTDYLPGSNRSGKFQTADKLQQLPLEETTLAEVFKPLGYQCWSVGKWHLGDNEFKPVGQGFDVGIAGNDNGTPGSYFWPYGHGGSGKNAKRAVPDVFEGGKPDEHLSDRLANEAIRLLEQRDPSKPFLLYFPDYLVHIPVQGKKELIRKFTEKAQKLGLPVEPTFYQEGRPERGTPRVTDWGDRPKGQTLGSCRETQNDPVYAAMVASLDETVGHLLAKLDELGLRENTIIVFTSDNGGHHITSNRPLRGSKGWLYEGGVRVPWIVKWPGVTKPGSVCGLPIINTDLMPTLLEACGFPARPEIHKDGSSFVPLLKGGAQPHRQDLFWHFPHYGNHGSGPASAVRSGDWKLIHWIENDSVELFNVAADPGETTELSAKYPERAAELRARIEQWRKETNANMPKPL